MIRHCITIFLTLLLIPVLSVVTRAQEKEPSLEEKILSIATREVENKRSPGIIVGYVDQNGTKIIGFGSREAGGNDKPDGATLYEIGTCTKLFTALLLSEMAERGEVKLDDPISTILPEAVTSPMRDGKVITLYDLATHTSGLPPLPDDFSPEDFTNPYADYTVEKMYDFLSHYALTRDIGSRYAYSNLGMGLLGHLLSLRAGKGYDELVRERICKPLEMTGTAVTLSGTLQSRLADGHDQYGRPVKHWDNPTLAGALSLHSCVQDLLKFLAANIGLKKTTLASAMERTHVLRDSTGVTTGHPTIRIAMGWHLIKNFDTNILWHGGASSGFRSFIGFNKEAKIGVVVLSNSTNDVNDIGLHLLNDKYTVREYYYKAPITDTVDAVLQSQGIEAAVKIYRVMKDEYDYKYDFSESLVNSYGYVLLQRQQISEAIEIFKLNVEAYPEAFNVYDSLGEAYMLRGEKELAIKNYEKSIELNPNNENGKRMLEKLKGN